MRGCPSKTEVLFTGVPAPSGRLIFRQAALRQSAGIWLRVSAACRKFPAGRPGLVQSRIWIGQSSQSRSGLANPANPGSGLGPIQAYHKYEVDLDWPNPGLPAETFGSLPAGCRKFPAGCRKSKVTSGRLPGGCRRLLPGFGPHLPGLRGGKGLLGGFHSTRTSLPQEEGSARWQISGAKAGEI